MKALSIRQPWAYFILCGKPWAKDVENRSWPAPPDMIGAWFQIHAPKECTLKEFAEACDFAIGAGALMLPTYDELPLGGIVGIARLVKSTRISESKWFVGPYGFVLQDAYPLPFEPCPGALGFFNPLSRVSK